MSLKKRLEETVRMLKVREQEFEGALSQMQKGDPNRPATQIGLAHIRQSLTDVGRERKRLDIW